MARYRAFPDEIVFPPCIVRMPFERTDEERLEVMRTTSNMEKLVWPFDDVHLILVASLTAREVMEEGLGQSAISLAELFSRSKNRGHRADAELSAMMRQCANIGTNIEMLELVSAVAVENGKCDAKCKTAYLKSMRLTPDAVRLWRREDNPTLSQSLYDASVAHFADGHGYGHELARIKDGKMQVDTKLSHELLGAITTTVCVVGYHKVVARLPDGFGPKKIKRATAGKRFFCFFESNPMHAINDTNGKTDRKLKTGHQRRSHYRHDWFRVGIDRRTLPGNPTERARMVQDYHVPTCRVKQAWIGPREFEVDGVKYKMIEGDQND